MSANSKDMILRLIAETKGLKTGLTGAEKMVKSFSSSAVMAFKAAAVGIGAVTATIGVGISKYADFSEELAKVGTMLGDQADKYLPEYEKRIRSLSVQYGETTGALSGGLYDILSASIGASEATKVLEVAVRAARAGMSDTKTAADAITTILNSYEMAASEAGSVSDMLFQTVARGKTTFDELAPQIGLVASSAATAGVSIEEMGAALATMTRTGVPTRQSITALRATIASFGKATDESKEAAASFGVDMSAATLRSKGLLGVLQDLKKAGATTDDLREIFPREEALAGLLPLFQQLDGFAADVNMQMDRGGVTAQAFENATNNLQFQFDRLGQALNNVWTMIGKVFGTTDAFGGAVSFIIDGLSRIAGMIETQKDNINDFFNFIVATAKSAFAFVASNIDTSGENIGGKAANIIVSLQKMLLDFVGEIYQDILSFFGDSDAEVSAFGKNVLSFIETLIPGVVENLQGFHETLRGLIAQASALFIEKWPAVKAWLNAEVFPVLVTILKAGFELAMTSIKTVLIAAWEAIKALVLGYAAELLKSITDQASNIGVTLVNLVKNISSSGPWIWTTIKTAFDYVKKMAAEWAVGLGDSLLSPVKSAWQSIKGVFDPEKKGSPSLMDRLNEVREAATNVLSGVGGDVAERVHGAMAGRIPGGELGGNISNNASITLNIQGILDDKLVRDQIVPQLERAAQLGQFSPARG